MQALRELQAIHEAADLELAVSAAMLAAHEAAKIVDHEAVIELQNRLDVRAPSVDFLCVEHHVHGNLWFVHTMNGAWGPTQGRGVSCPVKCVA